MEDEGVPMACADVLDAVEDARDNSEAISAAEDDEATEEDMVLFQLRAAEASDVLLLDEAGLQTSWQEEALREDGT